MGHGGGTGIVAALGTVELDGTNYHGIALPGSSTGSSVTGVYNNSDFSLISATTTNNGTKVYILPKVNTSGSVVNLLADSNLVGGTGVQVYNASGGGVEIASFMVAGEGVTIEETPSGALMISSSGSSSGNNYADYVIKDPDDRQIWQTDTLTNTIAASYKNITSGSSGYYSYKVNLPDYSNDYTVTLPTGNGTLALQSAIPTTYIRSIAGKNGYFTLGKGLAVTGPVLLPLPVHYELSAVSYLHKVWGQTSGGDEFLVLVINHTSTEFNSFGEAATNAVSIMVGTPNFLGAAFFDDLEGNVIYYSTQRVDVSVSDITFVSDEVYTES